MAEITADDLEVDFEAGVESLMADVVAEFEAVPEEHRAAYWLMCAAERVRKIMERRLAGEYWPDFLLDDNLSSLATSLARFKGEFKTDSRGMNFLEGAQAMRAMLANFVEQGGDPVTANSLRLNWNPSWGDDPGPPEA